ncbi:MAG: PilN domain-containing protein [Pseudomonadota bacterium]
MIRINLLPHREIKRKALRQQFYSRAGLITALAVLIVFLAYTVVSSYSSSQNDQNELLRQGISKLDKQIKQITELKSQTQALLERKEVIESLQRDRAEAVRLLSELTKQTPEGITLRNLKQDGQLITLRGYASSNARVSNLMRNIESSLWLEKPVLLEIKAITVDKRRLNEFNMTALIKREKTEDMLKRSGAKKTSGNQKQGGQ